MDKEDLRKQFEKETGDTSINEGVYNPKTLTPLNIEYHNVDYVEWLETKLLSTNSGEGKDCSTCCHCGEESDKPPCCTCQKNYWSNWEKMDI